MFDVRDLFSGKRRSMPVVMVLLLIAFACVAFSMSGGDDLNGDRREVLLRKVGHELLLRSGDSTSRVLPVEKIAGNEYRIAFEKEFAFMPDTLLNITGRVLAKDPVASDYVVNVHNCGSTGVVYGYAISKDKKDDIVACRGRLQPKGCYTISVKFSSGGINTAKNGYLLGSLPFLAFAGFLIFRSIKPGKASPGAQHTDVLALGAASFDPKNRKLVINGTTTDLTGTETRLLLIFAQSPNQAIERSRLQKEIWEDEGVVVGRSLDMFISKLRKKLEPDPNINILVIRGKGYKLEITQ
ncbi:winged helix-turn-helix domain-containing protein [Flavobacterium sp.]|uniref:winged helix-turn-helix domain-containing protein n=1 Tax=Flavobacterium sp. TaxID=239 RepID=UPI004034908E